MGSFSSISLLRVLVAAVAVEEARHAVGISHSSTITSIARTTTPKVLLPLIRRSRGANTGVDSARVVIRRGIFESKRPIRSNRL
jgi:hypothetical protein